MSFGGLFPIERSESNWQRGRIELNDNGRVLQLGAVGAGDRASIAGNAPRLRSKLCKCSRVHSGAGGSGLPPNDGLNLSAAPGDQESGMGSAKFRSSGRRQRPFASRGGRHCRPGAIGGRPLARSGNIAVRHALQEVVECGAGTRASRAIGRTRHVVCGAPPDGVRINNGFPRDGVDVEVAQIKDQLVPRTLRGEQCRTSAPRKGGYDLHRFRKRQKVGAVITTHMCPNDDAGREE